MRIVPRGKDFELQLPSTYERMSLAELRKLKRVLDKFLEELEEAKPSCK